MNRKGQNSGIFVFGFAIVFFIILAILIAGYDKVPAGHVGVTNRFGVVGYKQLEPGLHWTGVFTGTEPISIQIQKAEYGASAASQDLQVVSTKIALNYKLLPQNAPEIYKTIGIHYKDIIIEPIVQEAIKSQTAKYTAEDLVKTREEVKQKITDYITNKLENKGLVVTEVAITDFDFSDSFNQAIEQKQVAEQEALRAINQKRQMITESEARAEKQKLETDANAYQITTQAEAEAYALKVVREELQKSESLIQYKTIEKWNGMLPAYVVDDGSNILLTMGK